MCNISCKFLTVITENKERITTTTTTTTSTQRDIHCAKSVHIRSFAGMGENTDQKNSEYRHFSHRHTYEICSSTVIIIRDCCSFFTTFYHYLR